MTDWRIPFNRPPRVGTEAARIAEVIASDHWSGDGEWAKRAEALLQQIVHAKRVLLTPSATSALDMAALLLGVGPGDEVILPSFTFPSTANAFVLRGVRPIFADIRPDTLNLDERLLPHLITPRTKAIAVVHYAGVGCEMDAILDLGGSCGIPVIEDDAQGLFGSYRGRPLGSFGALGALSFHETKNISCGEGGALLINDERFVPRSEVIREKGTDRAAFARREVECYTWVDLGSSYLLSEILAAALLAQLEERSRIQTRRHTLWSRYATELVGWARARGVQLPVVPQHCTHPAHLFHLLGPTQAFRDALIAHLAERGILAPFHYLPLHLSPMGRRCGGRPGDCPVTESISERLLRLPLHLELTNDEQTEVIEAVTSFEGPS